jgi:FeS assembly SUF system regulator
MHENHGRAAAGFLIEQVNTVIGSQKGHGIILLGVVIGRRMGATRRSVQRLTGRGLTLICNSDLNGPDCEEDCPVLRLSKLTDYAVVVLTRLDDAAEGSVLTAPGLAQATGLAEPTVAKVLKILAHAGLVEGRRGALGGYRLTKPLADMPLIEVITAMDGPIALTACVDNSFGVCETEDSCPVRGRWDPVNEAIRRALTGISIADLAGPPAVVPHPETASPIFAAE